MAEQDEKFHILMNYGQCSLGEGCECIAQKNPRYGGAWAGIVCKDWLPLGAVSFDELIEMAKRKYANEHKN